MRNIATLTSRSSFVGGSKCLCAYKRIPTLVDVVAHLGGDVDNTEWQMENLRPNAQTLQAMQEVLGNKGKQYTSAQEYFAHLGV